MKKRHSTEQIVAKLRQADVELGKGLKVPEVCKQLGISEQTYYRWRQKYGGMDPAMAKQMKEMEKDANIVVHCHKGPRSTRAAELMRESGFSNVWHLTGGISAWIERIDPGLQDY